MPWFPLAPLVTLLALLGVAAVNWADAEQGRPGLLSTLAVMLLSAGCYIAVLRRRPGGWRTTDPETPAMADSAADA